MYTIFPRQHGLRNVFQGHYTQFKKVDKPSSKGPTIAKSKSQPWRLRKMKGLVEEMIGLNGRCKYMFLLQHYCPVKVFVIAYKARLLSSKCSHVGQCI